MSDNEKRIINVLEDTDDDFQNLESIVVRQYTLRRAITGEDYLARFVSDRVAICDIVDLNARSSLDSDAQSTYGEEIALQKAKSREVLGIPITKVIIISAYRNVLDELAKRHGTDGIFAAYISKSDNPNYKQDIHAAIEKILIENHDIDICRELNNRIQRFISTRAARKSLSENEVSNSILKRRIAPDNIPRNEMGEIGEEGFPANMTIGELCDDCITAETERQRQIWQIIVNELNNAHFD